MNDVRLFLLLKIVKQQQNLNSLLRAGLSYKSIAEFAELAASQKLLVISDNGIKLTLEGEKRFDELREINKKTNKDEWIDKEISSQIPKLDENFIFLPNQDELIFL